MVLKWSFYYINKNKTALKKLTRFSGNMKIQHGFL